MFEFFDGLLVDFPANYATTSLASQIGEGLSLLFFLVEFKSSIHVEIVVALDCAVSNLSERCKYIWLGQKSLESAVSRLLNDSIGVVLHHLRGSERLVRHLLNLLCQIVGCIAILPST